MIIYANGDTHDSDYGNACQRDVAQLPELINIEPQLVDIFDEKAEVQDCDVKECNSDKSAEVTKLCQVERCEENLPSFNCEIDKDDAKSENQKVTDDSKKTRACGKKATRPAVGNCKTKCTVPQPFALATEKRALYGTRPYGVESDNTTAGDKPSHNRVLLHQSSVKQNPVKSLNQF